MSALISELRYAVRQLAKSPGFTAVAVLTLALGIGANTVVFSLANAFLVRSLPYSHPERLGVLLNRFVGVPDAEQNSLFNILHDGESWELVRDHLPSVEVGASSPPNVPGAPQTIVNVKIGNEVESVRGGRVTANYFDVMGVHPLVGREFTREEDRPKGPNAVILSYELWNRMFDGDHDVLGKAMLVKGASYTIVGVMPPNLTITTPADLWTPLRPAADVGEGGGLNFFIYLRLRKGATWQQADAEISRLHPKIFDRIVKDYPNGQAWVRRAPERDRRCHYADADSHSGRRSYADPANRLCESCRRDAGAGFGAATRDRNSPGAGRLSPFGPAKFLDGSPGTRGNRNSVWDRPGTGAVGVGDAVSAGAQFADWPAISRLARAALRDCLHAADQRAGWSPARAGGPTRRYPLHALGFG